MNSRTTSSRQRSVSCSGAGVAVSAPSSSASARAAWQVPLRGHGAIARRSAARAKNFGCLRQLACPRVVFSGRGQPLTGPGATVACQPVRRRARAGRDAAFEHRVVGDVVQDLVAERELAHVVRRGRVVARQREFAALQRRQCRGRRASSAASVGSQKTWPIALAPCNACRSRSVGCRAAPAARQPASPGSRSGAQR